MARIGASMSSSSEFTRRAAVFSSRMVSLKLARVCTSSPVRVTMVSTALPAMATGLTPPRSDITSPRPWLFCWLLMAPTYRSTYELSGSQVHTRLRSPYAASIRLTGVR